jgi:hypothetical protein
VSLRGSGAACTAYVAKKQKNIADTMLTESFIRLLGYQNNAQ